MSTMRALQASKSPSGISLSLTSLPLPTPGPGEALIRIHASAIQPSDILNSTGSFPHTTFPRVLGRDFSGTVVKASSPTWQNKEIYGTSGPDFSFTLDGAQAEYAVVPESALAEKPKNLSFAQAAGLGTPLTTASLTLARAGIKEGDGVLVLGGTGAVGRFVVQVAKARGAGKVVSVGRRVTEGGTGEEGVVEVSSLADPGLKSVKEILGGKGPDVVVDTVGDFDLVRAAIEVMNEGGRFSFITAPRKGSTVLPVDILSFYRRRLSFLGCNSVEEPRESLAEMLRELVPDLESGKIVAEDEKNLNLITLDQAPEAYAQKAKKTVIVIE